MSDTELQYVKVGISPGGMTHLTMDGAISLPTLCGAQWFYSHEAGSDLYCKKCQYILAKNRRMEQESKR